MGYSKRREAQIASKNFKYRGVIGTIMTITREEGARALYNGLVPGLQRQMCFASVRIGHLRLHQEFHPEERFDVRQPPLPLFVGVYHWFRHHLRCVSSRCHQNQIHERWERDLRWTR